MNGAGGERRDAYRAVPIMANALRSGRLGRHAPDVPGLDVSGWDAWQCELGDVA